MTVLTRWEPFRELNTLQDRMNRLFRDSVAEAQDQSLTTSAFAPAVDVYEDEHNITLKIEVPGIDEKDIDVRIENNTLTVHGERKFEKEEKEENFRRVERQYGSFTRSFTLPTTVDAEKVSANYDKGHPQDHFGEEGGSQAQADQSQRRRRKDSGSQGSEQSRVSWHETRGDSLRLSGRVSSAVLLDSFGGRRQRLPFSVRLSFSAKRRIFFLFKQIHRPFAWLRVTMT